MNSTEPVKGELHDPGVVSAEDPATGEPDPALLKEASERASRGDRRLARQLAAEAERRRTPEPDSEAGSVPSAKDAPTA